jgi:threonine/homoserine/homoserine lactone efflux protein
MLINAMLPGLDHLIPFLLAGLALNLTPGPDMLLIIGRGVGQGRAAGIAAALGIGAGCIVHILAAAFGLAMLFEVEPIAYLVVKYLGAAYLCWLGLKLLFSSATIPGASAAAPAPLGAIFRQGIVTNVLNPKVALFFVAFLPQFVDPGATLGPAAQMIVLGTLFDVSGTIVNVAVACCFGIAGEWLRRRAGIWRWQQRVTGALFLALGCRLALPDRR